MSTTKKVLLRLVSHLSLPKSALVKVEVTVLEAVVTGDVNTVVDTLDEIVVVRVLPSVDVRVLSTVVLAVLDTVVVCDVETVALPDVEAEVDLVLDPDVVTVVTFEELAVDDSVVVALVMVFDAVVL